MSRVLLIKNANLYDPDPKGIRDILIVDEKVFSVAEPTEPDAIRNPCLRKCGGWKQKESALIC